MGIGAGCTRLVQRREHHEESDEIGRADERDGARRSECAERMAPAGSMAAARRIVAERRARSVSVDQRAGARGERYGRGARDVLPRVRAGRRMRGRERADRAMGRALELQPVANVAIGNTTSACARREDEHEEMHEKGRQNADGRHPCRRTRACCRRSSGRLHGTECGRPSDRSQGLRDRCAPSRVTSPRVERCVVPSVDRDERTIVTS